MRAGFKAVLAGVLVLAAARVVSAQVLAVAAASDLQSALPAIAAEFERETGQQVTVTFGSSGTFFTQIQNGAPFDVFLSADIDYPRKLEAAGQAERGSLYQYATGRIVLWTRNDSGVDLARGLAGVTDPRVRRIAIANPEHAPYGRAAIAALRHERVYDAVQSRFVLGENISQAAQFAQSGGAEVGIIALSLALSPAMKSAGNYVDVPASWHPPIAQAATIVSASKQKALARRFIDFLKRPETARLLQTFGFATP